MVHACPWEKEGYEGFPSGDIGAFKSHQQPTIRPFRQLAQPPQNVQAEASPPSTEFPAATQAGSKWAPGSVALRSSLPYPSNVLSGK